MHISAQEIASLVEGELHGDPRLVITGVAGLEEAGPGDVSFVSNKKYLKLLPQSKAGLMLIPGDIPLPARPFIRVNNTLLAYAKVLSVVEA